MLPPACYKKKVLLSVSKNRFRKLPLHYAL